MNDEKQTEAVETSVNNVVETSVNNVDEAVEIPNNSVEVPNNIVETKVENIRINLDAKPLDEFINLDSLNFGLDNINVF